MAVHLDWQEHSAGGFHQTMDHADGNAGAQDLATAGNILGGALVLEVGEPLIKRYHAAMSTRDPVAWGHRDADISHGTDFVGFLNLDNSLGTYNTL